MVASGATGRRAAGAGWRAVRRVHAGPRGDADVVALDDLTLTVGAGELVVLVGPSGSGKSTALRILAGIEQMDGGAVEIDGEDVSAAPAHQRDVAMVFQDLALFPHLTVLGNIVFGERARGRRRDAERRVHDEIAPRLGITEVLARRPGELSGGQQQRVALARAMIRDPAVFLLDEPLSNLDARLRLDARAEIVALQKRLGTTMVHVTHDQAEAMTMGDRIAVLRDGRLEQVGTPREIYDDPATAFVASFLGSPPMNLLPADALPGAVGADRVGVRPEDVLLAEPAAGRGLPGTVAQVEDLGSETLLLVDTTAGQVVARRGPREPLRPGALVTVGLAPDGRLHRFGADGRRLGAR